MIDSKFTKHIKKANRTNTLVALVLFVFLIVSMWLPAKSLSSIDSDSVPFEGFVQLENERSITSELNDISYGNNFESINIFLATNARINSGELQVELIKNDEVIELWKIRTEDIEDCCYSEFRSSNNIRFETGDRYFVRITDYYNGDNNIAVGVPCLSTSLTSSVEECAGQTICAYVSSFDSAFLFESFLVLSILTIVILFILCTRTEFLRLPSYKIAVGAVLAIILIFVVQFDVLKGIKTDYIVKEDDVVMRQSIAPGESMDFDFCDDFDSFHDLSFVVYGANKSEYLVSMVNKTTGVTYLYNSDSSLFRSLETQDGIIQKLDVTSSLCPTGLFEEGDYVVSIQNTSPNEELIIGITCEATEESNPLIAVTLERTTKIGRIIALAVIVILAIYVLTVYYLTDGKDLSIEKFFVVSVVPLSLIYLVLFQLINISDAYSHFGAAYRFSNALLGITGNNEWMLRSCDGSYIRCCIRFSYSPVPALRDIGYALNHAFIKTDADELVKALSSDVYKMRCYSVFNWLPQVLGLTVGRILGCNSIVTVYLGRLFILIVYIYTCYRAIKNIPVGKFIICCVALLPSSLSFASSYSYDCMLMIVSLNFIAIVLKLRSEITNASIVELMIWSFLLGSVKGGGALILLPLVLLLVKKDKKSIILVISSLLISGLSYFLFSKVFAPAGMFQLGVGNDGKMTASFAFSNPVEYLKMMIRTYVVSGDSLFYELLGSKLSWRESVIPSIVVIAIFIATLLGSGFEKNSKCFSVVDRFILASPIVLSILFTPAMLLSWTPIGSSEISGIQGRYYVFVFPLFLILLSDKIKYKNISKCYKVFAYLMCISLYYMIRLYLHR